MSEQINININETNENINITSTEIVEVIDINVGETIEEVTLNITEEVIQVNINKVTAGGGAVSSVNGETGDVVINIPTLTSDLTNDSGFITAAEVPTVNDATDTIKGILKLTNDLGGTADAPTVPALANKVDKVTGKGLSTNDYTTAEQTKLAGIADGAEVNVNADWNATTGDALILNKPTIPTSLPPNGTAGGDLQGTYPNPTVHQIQGQSVQNGNPAEKDVLFWDNTAKMWKHRAILTTDISDSDGVHLVTTAQQTIINNTSGINTGDNATNTQYSSLATSKQDTLVSGTNIKTIEGQSILGSGNIDLNKSDVGLSNVDNTSDINKPISTVTQNALDLKQNASTRRNANNSTNNNINYCGVALGTGISESSAVWTIKRLTISASGSITIATATNVAWTNRQSATYI